MTSSKGTPLLPMTSPRTLEELLAKSVETTSALNANEMISRMREEMSPGRVSMSYEVLWPHELDVASAIAKIAPPLIYFLECQGAKLPNASGVFVSLFVGESLHFIRAADFAEFSACVLGLSMSQLSERYGQAVS